MLNIFRSKKFDYQTYLKSPSWDRKRRKVLKRDEYRCQLNYSHTGKLHVHHKTYERIGKERLSDLITLCESCHRLIHGK